MKKRPPVRAEKFLSDLNMAHALIVLCESSLFMTTHGRTLERQVVRLCKAQSARLFRLYVKAQERAP